ncbi:MAG TPA: GNAT family N-acetyltransferase [Aequorivita sp.]|nr:GNAT family N-acetyltransferase [Aequorivita sp.]
MMETAISIRIIPKLEILSILPLLQKLGNFKLSEEILKERLLEMAQQNYECIGVYENERLVGICGLWFQTRHYAGRSVEMDHVIVGETHRNHGIGKQLIAFVVEYAREKSCQWIELNTYVDNFLSHKFYYNQGFVAKGYHFVREL